MTRARRTYLIWGLHAVRSALRNAPETLLEAWIDPGTRAVEMGALRADLERLGVTPQSASRDTLDRLTTGGRHQGIAVRRRAGSPGSFEDLCSALQADNHGALLLILDGVQDPHNLGACLRVADAAGVRAVVTPKDRAAPVTGAVEKAASGAADTMPVVTVTNLTRALVQLQAAGLWLVGAVADSERSIYEVDMTVPLGLVLGGEARGLRRLTRETCDLLAAIPMHGTVESLNVSTAAAVCLFEANRQRRVATVSQVT